jgi:hypothetical protein
MKRFIGSTAMFTKDQYKYKPMDQYKQFMIRLLAFIEKYEITVLTGNYPFIFECSDENYLLIRLTCPEVIADCDHEKIVIDDLMINNIV